MQNQYSGMAPQQFQNGISSPAVSPQANPNLGYKDVFYQLEQAIGADVQNINNLMSQGVLSQQQGQYLLAQLSAKAQSINMYKNAQNQTPANVQNVQVPPVQSQNSLDLFNQEHPGFFDVEGRGELLKYIKGFDMDKDEIFHIAQLVEGLENSAVDEYLKKSEYEKSLNDENVRAKSKLMSYAQNSTSDNKMNKVFTREEIGRMSGDEFAKNEKLIMEQVKQGLIK